MHEIKQAVNYMSPELLLRNAPPPPASNFVHFYATHSHIYGIVQLLVRLAIELLSHASLYVEKFQTTTLFVRHSWSDTLV